MNICIFDTETTSLDKPFCYNIGYVIVNAETNSILLEKDFVVEQVWHNLPLFSTSYYAEKRPLYVASMRAKKTLMKKFGYICQEMIRDFKAYEIENTYAYNSNFDERVFEFNCEWFKCNNPFDNVKIFDIRGFAHEFLINEDYLRFCEKNELFTESGNYSTTAETMFRYMLNDMDFHEEHTALADSQIEKEILMLCYSLGADLNNNYQAKRSIERKIIKHFEILVDKKKVFETDYSKMRLMKNKGQLLFEK